jgi:hypothetical protein
LPSYENQQRAKHVVPEIARFRTGVRFPPPPPIQAPRQSQKGRNPQQNKGSGLFHVRRHPMQAIATRGQLGAAMGATAPCGDTDAPKYLSPISLSARPSPLRKCNAFSTMTGSINPQATTRSPNALKRSPGSGPPSNRRLGLDRPTYLGGRRDGGIPERGARSPSNIATHPPNASESAMKSRALSDRLRSPSSFE